MDEEEFEIVCSVDMVAGAMGGGDEDRGYSKFRGTKRGAVEQEEGAPREIVLCPVLEENVTAEQLVARVRVTESEARRVESYEQGTEPWYLSRRGSQTRLPDGIMFSDRLRKASETGQIAFQPGRLTASNFGTAAGHNKYTPPKELVADMLWGIVVSNDAMRYGTEMEPVACDVFQWAMFFLTGGATELEHRGLMLGCPGLAMQGETGEGVATSETMYEGWCGTSPDGIVHYRPQEKGTGSGSGSASAPTTPLAASLSARPRSLLEIKCPSVNKRNFYSERRGNEQFGIPHYYYDQIQGIMGLQKIDDAYFVVHLPDRTQISWYMFDPEYYTSLFDSMKRFWFELYLPAALACAHGKLVEGEVDVRKEVEAREAMGEVVVADPSAEVEGMLNAV